MCMQVTPGSSGTCRTGHGTGGPSMYNVRLRAGFFLQGREKRAQHPNTERRPEDLLSSSLLSPGLTGKCPLNVSRILADNPSDDTAASILVNKIIKATPNFRDRKAGPGRCLASRAPVNPAPPLPRRCGQGERKPMSTPPCGTAGGLFLKSIRFFGHHPSGPFSVYETGPVFRDVVRPVFSFPGPSW